MFPFSPAMIGSSGIGTQTKKRKKMFIPTFISGSLSYRIGSSKPLNLPAPPVGQHLMLYTLVANGGSLSGVSVKSNGANLVLNKALTNGDVSASNGFYVSCTGTVTEEAVPEILFSQDAVGSITTATVTESTVFYQYAHGNLV